ncbi:MAG: HD domain-containing protein [Rickettsiales bacterium]|jgi:HD superfamily phosphohydrolase YqeK|nr:HD domain-containing protein [Rickettsiales bacterium]
MNDRDSASKIILDAYFENLPRTSGDERSQAWMVHKVRHTFQVESAMTDIVSSMPGLSEADARKAGVAALLHDLGRFYQTLGDLSFRHGAHARALLQRIGKFDDPAILFAIEEHDKHAIDYANPLYAAMDAEAKKSAGTVAKLLRDADKLGNMRDFVRHYIPSLLSTRGSGLSTEAREAVERGGETVDYRLIKTKADEIAGLASWVVDINFAQTRGFIAELDYIATCAERMAAAGASPEECALVRAAYSRYESP